jgi:hypothetical protein
MKSLDTTVADADPKVAAAVRLLHRRRGWIWTTVISVIAWVTVAGLLGQLAPNATGGPGVAVASILILLLTLVAVVGLIASVVDTVRLHHRHPGAVRLRASALTAHYPARAHAYSYPPRHRSSWVFSWIMLLILVGIGVPVLPGLVDGAAYLAGAESSSTFLPLSYSQDCGRGGCTTVTDGTLASGSVVTWPDQVPLGQAFTVHEPLWDWGFGTRLINGDGVAIGYLIGGLLVDGFALLVLIHLAKLVSRWLGHRRQSGQLTGTGWR